MIASLDIEAATEKALSLPEKSKGIYEKAYNSFKQWCDAKEVSTIDEKVMLAYFSTEMNESKASTAWSVYSMLRLTLSVNDNVQISGFNNLRALLKRKNDGYIAKKSRILRKEEVLRFIKEAPDAEFLAVKVALIVGVYGACRRDELVRMSIDDIEYIGSDIKVTIPHTKTKIVRKYVISAGDDPDVNLVDIVKKYIRLRQPDSISRFFMGYRNGKCTKQPIGINSIGAYPEKIATFLQLPFAAEYTGHCFRRSSASLLADSRVVKGHGGWLSDKVAAVYVEASLNNNGKIAGNDLGEKIVKRDEQVSSIISTQISSSIAMDKEAATSSKETTESSTNSFSGLENYNYDEFFELINQKINNQSDYKSLCRFCLERNSNGVDVSSECAEAFALQDNYYTITKQCLQITSEHPNFVCCACEHRLSDIASFIQEIIENGKHWESYLENEKDVKPERIEEIDCNYHEESVDVTMTIKVENYEVSSANETNVSYVLDYSLLPDKLSTEHGDGLNTSDMQIDTNNRKRKRNTERETFRTHPTTLEYERTCKFCDTPTFETMTQFYRHQYREHPGEKCFSCDICGLNFTTKFSTYVHMKDTHWNDRSEYHCQYCAKVFFKSATLNSHENSLHLNARPYHCHLCVKRFTTKQSLDKHMRSLVHSAFWCTVCNASFDESSHLSVHFKREHPNNRPLFQCSFCDKCYFEHDKLASHVQWHNQQKRVLCDM